MYVHTVFTLKGITVVCTLSFSPPLVEFKHFDIFFFSMVVASPPVSVSVPSVPLLLEFHSL